MDLYILWADGDGRIDRLRACRSGSESVSRPCWLQFKLMATRTAEQVDVEEAERNHRISGFTICNP